jgi:predicted PurR-regulated permease PerM
MFVFRVPYAVLPGVLTFVLEFVPVVGTLISGAICVLIALTQGWVIAISGVV